jgi:AraC-like DNA-binding protein
MEIVFDRIHVPHKHSFISRKVQCYGQTAARIHSHTNFELNYVLHGSGRRIVGNNICTFESGDLVLLGPDLPHCWESPPADGDTPAYTSIVIHFFENILGSDFFNIPELKEIEALLKKANVGIWFKVTRKNEIQRSLERLVTLQGLESYIELLKVFNLLLKVKDYEFLSDTSYAPVYAKDLHQINLVYEYVFQNIQQGIKQEEAAALLHMTPGAFCRYFKKKTNRTFMEYVKSVRIRLAAKMLAETDRNISQVCYESGYNNIANFNYQFKSVMHKTPSEYRKIFR